MTMYYVQYTGTQEWVCIEAESKVVLAQQLKEQNRSGIIRTELPKEATVPKVHNKHAKTAPPNAVYIGRPSKWGNPFAIGKDGNREDVIRKHREWILGNPALLAQLPELKGKDLVCFCAPQACHGDTLIQLANEPQEVIVPQKVPTPSSIVKLEKLSQEQIDSIISKLEEKILPHLEKDVSNYAKGRMRVWMPYEAPLSNERPFTEGVLDDEIWQWIVDLCAKHGFKAQVALISKGGNIKPHRDTTYAAPWAMGINLGECRWMIAEDRQSARPDRVMNLKGGEVFKFNSKHVHAVEDASPDRWAINVWAIADSSAAKDAQVTERLQEMLQANPQVQEFIDFHQPGIQQNNQKEDTVIEKPMYRIAFTGHRPSDIGGYDPTAPKRVFVKNAIKAKLQSAIAKFGDSHEIIIITGGALGVDQDAALIAQELGLAYIVAVPCQNHDAKWNAAQKVQYKNILANAKQVVLVHDGPYNNTCMQDRNEWMVDRCDVLIAVWTGKQNGGTYNCIKYAQKVERKIVRINPNDFQEEQVNTASFKGTFLSNFWPVEIEYDGDKYPSVENFYQAMKIDKADSDLRHQYVFMSPAQAKQASKGIKLRDDWNKDLAQKIMLYGLRKKFARGSELAQMLLDTGDQELVETNYWHDNFWGNCTCNKCVDKPGENKLGLLLMQVRDELNNNGGGEPTPEPKNNDNGPTIVVQQPKEVEMTKELANGIVLNAEQAAAFDAVVNGTGSALLTGNAGTGKSFLVNQIIEEMGRQGKHVLVTASTGIAGTHIGGTTFSSALKVLPINNTYMSFEKMVQKTVGDMTNGMFPAINKIEAMDLIIVDEVSMIHPRDFARLDAALRQLLNPSKPFGGKRFLFVGDFLQIEPVEKDPNAKLKYVFETKVWKNAGIKTFLLTKIVRQSDAYWAAFLNNVRQGLWTKRMEPVVTARSVVKENVPAGVPFLLSTNKDVDAINNKMMEELPGESRTYRAIDKIGFNQYEDYWDKNCLAPRELTLKVGAQVICLANNHDIGLVNGDVGIVVELGAKYVVVDFNRLGQITMLEHVFSNGDPKQSSRIQLPLKPAWALTIHKSQGMTLDCAAINAANAFASGQVYVALSRVRSLEGLYITGFNPGKIKTEKCALDFYGLKGNLVGEEAEALCHMRKLEEGGSGFVFVAPTPEPTPNSNNEVTVEEITEEELTDDTVEEQPKEVEMIENENNNKSVKFVPANGGIMEYLVSMNAPAGNIDNDTHRMISRIITNDPEYFFAQDNAVVLETIDRGSYKFILLEHMFAGKSFAVNITAFKDPMSNEIDAYQGVWSALTKKKPEIAYGFADFDAETIIRIRGIETDDYLSMKQFGLVIGNSEKMTKRLVELTKSVRAWILNSNNKRLRIKILSHEAIQIAFPYLSEDNVKKVADGINFMSVEVAKRAYRNNYAMDKRSKKKLLNQIEDGKITNHTIRVITNVDGQAGLVKGNVLTNTHEKLNARMRELGFIDKDEEYDIFVCEDNFKTEFGTDGSFELLTLEPHHGVGMVKTNDQMLAQYEGMKGVFDAEELLEAFQVLMDKAYNDLVQGRDIQMFANIHHDRAVTEQEKIERLTKRSQTTNINKMIGVLNDLELGIGVSQTLMFARANGIEQMFLVPGIKEGMNWTASSRYKRSFMFQPWAYRAYIMSKEAVYMAGYDVDLTNQEGEYHAETQTFMIPGNLVAVIMGKLGGGDFDDEVGVHIRKMVMKDESIRLVAFLVRTPNDWAEYYIIDISDYGPVFLGEEDGIDLPTIYEADFDKFNSVSIAGQLPSKVNGSQRPKKAVWDWELTGYNADAATYKGASVGGQVKTKMLWYSLKNKPFKTLPCLNEDMIDAMQQCKGDIPDLQALQEWSLSAMAYMVTCPDQMDAYWWRSRNMAGTVKMLEVTDRIAEGTATDPLKPEQSSIVRDFMVPREAIVRQTKKKMIEWLNANIHPIPELSGIINNGDEDMKYRQYVTEFNRMFELRPADFHEYSYDQKREWIGKHYKECATKITQRFAEYKARVGEDKFNMHILKMVYISWRRKHEHNKRNFSGMKNYDAWLYTVAPDAEMIMTDYFYDAMTWYRNRQGR